MQDLVVGLLASHHFQVNILENLYGIKDPFLVLIQEAFVAGHNVLLEQGTKGVCGVGWQVVGLQPGCSQGALKSQRRAFTRA